jgi:cytidylate kinase
MTTSDHSLPHPPEAGPLVAIDGPAASGKSTVGRMLADNLHCAYLDTGLMYRVVTLRALQHGADLTDGGALATLARNCRFTLQFSGGEHLRVDGEQVGTELHGADVDGSVSVVAAHPQVRAVLVATQRSLARRGSIVMVGRDIGTVVLPDAPVKLWVTASPEERARRRVRDHFSSGEPVSYVDELARIRDRDARDAGRATSPLRQADDAIVVETDGLSPDEVAKRALELIMARPVR